MNCRCHPSHRCGRCDEPDTNNARDQTPVVQLPARDEQKQQQEKAQMAILFEGECIGKVSNPEVGPDTKGKPRVRWDMLVTDGEHKGKRASYSGKLDEENIKFTKRDMMLVGWKGKDVRTFVADVKAADRVIPFTAEIASNTYEDTGKTSQWTSVRFTGSKPLGEFDDETARKMNEWFAAAGDVGAAKPGDDIPF
jgi:hypothetical protein